MDYARPLPVIEHILGRASTRRQTLLAARDRRERDMLTALADVENYERQLAYSTRDIDQLLEERERARAQVAAAEIEAIADSLVTDDQALPEQKLPYVRPV